MRRLILFIYFIFFVADLQASHIKWYGDYEKAHKIAKLEDKPMMIILRKDDCNECQKMFEITFRNQPYIKELNKHFISVIVDFDSLSNYPIELFYTTKFPALFFVNPKDESFIYKSFFGFITPDTFLTIPLDKLHSFQKTIY
jgi:hypothetical protein